jgi:hypothetical protein
MCRTSDTLIDARRRENTPSTNSSMAIRHSILLATEDRMRREWLNCLAPVSNSWRDRICEASMFQVENCMARSPGAWTLDSYHNLF